MSRLTRYLLVELGLPLVAWAAFIFLLLFLMQFLRGSEVLLGSAVTARDVGGLTLLLAPHILTTALPVALLLAILLGMGRLSEDRELTALAALGQSPLRMTGVPLLYGALTAGVMVLLAYTAEPWGMNALKGRVAEIMKKNVMGDVKAGVFYEDLTQLTLYAQEVDPPEEDVSHWRNVLVHDDRDPNAPMLVLARRGQVSSGGPGEDLTLTLKDGEIHRAARSSSDYAVVSFERAEIPVGVSEGGGPGMNRLRAPKEELAPSELAEAARRAEARGESSRPFWVAYHARLGSALSPLAFALFGAPLAIARRQAGRARGSLVTLGAYVAYYVLSRLFENLGTQGRLAPWMAGQLCNLLFVALGIWVLRRAHRIGVAR